MRLGGTVTGQYSSVPEWEDLLVRSRFRAVTAPFSCRTPEAEITAYMETVERHDVRIAEIVGGIGLLRRKCIFRHFCPVHKIRAGRVHDGFRRLVIIVVAGVERVIAAVLVLHDTSRAERVILLGRGIRVRDHDPVILKGAVIFRPVKSPGMIARFPVALIREIEDVHLPVFIERHRVTDIGAVRHWKEGDVFVDFRRGTGVGLFS